MSAEVPPLQRERASGSAVQWMVLLWCLWLLGSWAVGQWYEASGQGGRWMLMASVTWLVAVWPTIRLGQLRQPPLPLGVAEPADVGERWRRWRLLELGVEWLCMVMVFQAVLWPLVFVMRWSIEQAIWLNVAMVGWSAAAAALVGWGCLFGGRCGRVVAGVLCLLLLVGEPAVVAVASLFWSGWGGPWGVSPIPVLWALSEQASRVSLEPWQWYAVGMVVAAGVAWALLAFVVGRMAEREAAR